MGALPFWQKLKMGWHLLTSRDPIRLVGPDDLLANDIAIFYTVNSLFSP